MRHSFFTLRALATLTLSTASALPQHVDQGILAEQTFSCSGEQTLSLCCTGRIPSNGAVEDCQESVHFMIGPTRLSAHDLSRQLHSTTVNQCSSEQLQKGYNRPVCCKAGFKPAAGAPGYNGLNCIKGAVDGGSKWSFEPKAEDKSPYSSSSKREPRSTIPKTSPLAAAVETIPVADDESWVFALAPEPEFPEHLEGSPTALSSSHSPAELNSLLSEKDLPLPRRSLRKRSSEISEDAAPSGSGHQTQDAVLEDLLSKLESPKRNLSKRSLGMFSDEEPSGNGHQTQDAVLKDLLTSTSLIQRSTALRRRNSRGSAPLSK